MLAALKRAVAAERTALQPNPAQAGSTHGTLGSVPAPAQTTDHHDGQGCDEVSAETSKPGPVLWTLQEDEFIVDARCFLPQVEWKEMKAIYADRRAKSQSSFPKKKPSIRLFKQRLDQLKHPSNRARFDLLFHEANSKTQRIVEPSSRSYYRDELVNRKQPGIKPQSLEQAGPGWGPVGEIEDEEYITLRVCRRRRAPYKIRVPGKLIASFSEDFYHCLKSAKTKTGTLGWGKELFDPDLAVPAPAASVAVSRRLHFNASTSVLTLSDDHPKYRRIRTYDHLGPDIMKLFTSFLRQPNLVRRLRVLQHRAHCGEEAQEQIIQENLASIKREEQAWKDELEKRFKEETAAVRQTLEAQLEEDIRVLRFNHERLLAIETRKLQAEHTTRVTAVQKFYQREASQAQERVEGSWSRELQTVRREKLECAQRVEELMPLNLLPRLFVLAEDLQAHALLDACIERAVAPGTITTLALHPAWSCPIIRDVTFARLIGSLHLQDLASLASFAIPDAELPPGDEPEPGFGNEGRHSRLSAGAGGGAETTADVSAVGTDEEAIELEIALELEARHRQQEAEAAQAQAQARASEKSEASKSRFHSMLAARKDDIRPRAESPEGLEPAHRPRDESRTGPESAGPRMAGVVQQAAAGSGGGLSVGGFFGGKPGLPVADALERRQTAALSVLFNAVHRELVARKVLASETYRRMTHQELLSARASVAKKVLGPIEYVHILPPATDKTRLGESPLATDMPSSYPGRVKSPDRSGRGAGFVRAGGVSEDSPEGGGPLLDMDTTTHQVFFDVLEEEVAARREFGSVCLSKVLLPRALSLSEDGTIVSTSGPYKYGTAVATKERTAGQFGQWMFEVEIISMPKRGASISVGWDVPRSAMTWGYGSAEAPSGVMIRPGEVGNRGVVILGVTPSEDDSAHFGVCWQSSGPATDDPDQAHQWGSPRRSKKSQHDDSFSTPGRAIFRAGGKSVSGFSGFGEGDVIGCTIDQNAYPACLRFYKNGTLCIPASSDEKSSGVHPHSHPGFPIGRPDTYSVTPAVCMYTSDPMYPCKARVSFREPFRYPIEGFEAFGAEWPHAAALDDAAGDASNAHTLRSELFADNIRAAADGRGFTERLYAARDKAQTSGSAASSPVRLSPMRAPRHIPRFSPP